jgi:hypothetical protein
VVAEPPEAERHPFESLDEVVGRLGRSVAEMSSVPVGGVFLPAGRSAPQRAHLRRGRSVLQVLAEALDEACLSVFNLDVATARARPQSARR